MPDGKPLSRGSGAEPTTAEIWDRAVAKALEERAKYRASEPRWRNPLDTHAHDRLGRRQPRIMPVSSLLGWIPGIGERVREVPIRAIAENGEDDEGVYALLACPCDHRPIVRQALGKCPGCERYYIGAGDRVFVIYGAMAPPERPEVEAV